MAWRGCRVATIEAGGCPATAHRRRDEGIARMTIGSTNLDELLDPATLRLPKSPRVLEIRHEPYTDWAGDEALRVWVVLSDDTSEAQRRWARIAPIDQA